MTDMTIRHGTRRVSPNRPIPVRYHRTPKRRTAGRTATRRTRRWLTRPSAG